MAMAVAVASPSPLRSLAPTRFQFPHTVKVGSKSGEQEPPLPLVSGSNISRGNDSVAPAVSERHEVASDDIPSEGDDARAVFQEDPSRSPSVDCAQASGIRWPGARAADSRATACCANIAAREARCESIHATIHGGRLPRAEVGALDVEVGPPAGAGLVADAVAAPRIEVDGVDAAPVEDGAGPQTTAEAVADVGDIQDDTIRPPDLMQYIYSTTADVTCRLAVRR